MLFSSKPFLVVGKQLTYMLMMHRLYYCVPFAVSFQLHTPCKLTDIVIFGYAFPTTHTLHML